MIEFIHGDIFYSDCQAWVNTVNCVGVAGKGIALYFRRRYPQMYIEYNQICAENKLKPGGVWAWHNPAPLPEIIFNFATKGDWRLPSQYSFIHFAA